MKAVRITFNNGDIITTNINGTKDEIKEYYGKGQVFNIGVNGDKLVNVEKCEFLKECYFR